MAVSKFGQMFPKNEEQQVDMVQNKLKDLPPSMVIFSQSLRSLYAENQVTGNEETTVAFLEVRNNARQNGVVYATKVLPMTEKVIRAIGFFADYFTDLDFEDWSESLEDIINDVDKAQGVCDILRQMHNSIIIDLKKNEDMANVSITQMDKMAQQYREQEADLIKKAGDLNKEADNKRWWGAATAGLTLGISTVILNSYAKGEEAIAKKNIALAVARRENADIVDKAVCLTSGNLIPAVKAFINGLEVCSEFLSDTRERLEKMRMAGEKGSKKPYYTMMKKRAGELNGTCLQFLALTDMMRNNLAAIPAEPEDRNYVDKWFDQQQELFEKEHKSIWGRIKGEVAKIAYNVDLKTLQDNVLS